MNLRLEVKETDGQDAQQKVRRSCEPIVNKALWNEVTLEEGCCRAR